MDALQPYVAPIELTMHPGEARDAWRLKDGTVIMLRAARPDDGEKIQALVQGLSMESRYRRFFYPLRQLMPAMLARFTDADPIHAMTLLAVVQEREQEIAVGMGQYVAEPYPKNGEFAVVVSDAWQRNGIAMRLMRNLICIARTAGIESFEGDVLADNEPMRQLLIGLDFTIRAHPEGAYLIRAQKELAAPAWKCSELAMLAVRASNKMQAAHT